MLFASYLQGKLIHSLFLKRTPELTENAYIYQKNGWFLIQKKEFGCAVTVWFERTDVSGHCRTTHKTTEKMEIAKGISIPVIADFVLSPDVLYSDELTAIYFQTENEQYGRITFENLDALKICRGENLPFTDNWEEGQKYPWVYKIENSKWLKERFDYENENYGSFYEFGGNVNEMLTDFSHYVFKFHDQFVEVIARGFWFEQDKTSLFKRELQIGHPFLNLPDNNLEKFVSHNLTCQVRTNTTPQDKLVSDAKFCSQKLIEFALELDGKASVDNSLILSYRNGKLISSLRGFFGKHIVEFEGLAKLTDVKPYIEKYIEEVYERRKAMGK